MFISFSETDWSRVTWLTLNIVARHLEMEFLRDYGTWNTDQRLVYFHLVAGTCPTNSSHAGTSIIWGDKSLRLVPRNQTMFEFVGRVAGTKFWSLRLNFWWKWVVHTKGLGPRDQSRGLVAGTSPFVCADLYVFRLGIFLLYKKLNECQEVCSLRGRYCNTWIDSGKVLHKLSLEPAYKLDVKIWP